MSREQLAYYLWAVFAFLFSVLSGLCLLADGPSKEVRIKLQQEKIEWEQKYGWAPSRRQPHAVPYWKGHSERIAKEEAKLEEIRNETGIGHYLKFGALFVISTGAGIVLVMAASCEDRKKAPSS